MRMLIAIVMVTLLSGCGGQQYASPEEFYLSFERDFTCGESVDTLRERYFDPGHLTDQYLALLQQAVQQQSALVARECADWDMAGKLAQTEVRFISNSVGHVYGRTTWGNMSRVPGIHIRANDDRYVIVVGN